VLVTTSSKWVYMLNSIENGCVRAKGKKTVVDGASPFNPPFWSFEKEIYDIFFYRTFYLTPKFQLICNQIDLAMENSS
jgi:hypothetical protein